MITRASSGLPSGATTNFANAAETMRSSFLKAAKVAEKAAEIAAEKGGKAYDHVGQKVQQMSASASPPWPAQALNMRRVSSGTPHWSCEGRPVASGPLPEFEIRVCSWNLHGSLLSGADDVGQWLSPGDGADVYVIGVQELVELGARSVVLGAGGDEQRQQALEARAESILTGAGVAFVKVCSFGMVGLGILVYIRQHLAPFLRDLDCDRVKTGMQGGTGNKGCVCTRFLLGHMSFCFVNVHLASGQGAAQDRNQHLQQILSDGFQGTSSTGSTRPAKQCFQRRSRHTIMQHDFSVIFGDFNSRLDLPKEELWPPGKVDEWLALDQVLCGQAPSLKGYREGVIVFPPTYKYKEGTDDFNKKRIPAWCDRVVFKTESSAMEVEMVEYDSQALKHTSDHRPVAAQFHIAPIVSTRSIDSCRDSSAPATDPWAMNIACPNPNATSTTSGMILDATSTSCTTSPAAEPDAVIALPDASCPITATPSIIALPPPDSLLAQIASPARQASPRPAQDATPNPDAPATAPAPWPMEVSGSPAFPISNDASLPPIVTPPAVESQWPATPWTADASKVGTGVDPAGVTPDLWTEWPSAAVAAQPQVGKSVGTPWDVEASEGAADTQLDTQHAPW